MNIPVSLPKATSHTLLKNPYYISAGWLIDGSGGPILKDVLIEISSGCIISISRGGHGDPDGNSIVDLSNCTLIPGLIDSHVHLSMSGNDDQEIRRQQLNASFYDVQGVIANHIKDHLAHGVAALRDGGDHAGHTLRYRNELLFHRESPVTLRAAGRAWHAQGRYGSIIGRHAFHGQSLAQGILN
ncbi:MAG: amidohydrolase family protein, partial [Deltaproteobacteria bacterium]|nr:amidohydrolase family protein [Deltaproteobacteria bacterium]